MRQFDFLATWDDSWRIVEALLEMKGVSLIPDFNYSEPEPQTVSELSQEVRDKLQQRAQLFIWSDSFSLHPPVLKRIEGRTSGVWYSVTAQEGGPCLSLMLPACYHDGGHLNLASGTLSCQKLYLNPNSGNWEPPTIELVNGFKQIVRLLKNSFLQRHQLHVAFWAGKNAIHEIVENDARVHGYGLD